MGPGIIQKCFDKLFRMANIFTTDRTRTFDQPHHSHQERHTQVTLFCRDRFEEDIKDLSICEACQFVKIIVDACKVERRILHINKKQCQHLDGRFTKALQECQPYMAGTALQSTKILAVEEFYSVVLRASSLVEECSGEKWLLKAVELGETPEHFVEVLLDLHWAIGLVHLGAGKTELKQLRVEQEELRGSLRGQNVEKVVLSYRVADKKHLKEMVQTAEEHSREDSQERCLALLLKDRLNQHIPERSTRTENSCSSEPSWHPKELEEFVTGFSFEIGIKTRDFWKLSKGGSGVVMEFPKRYYGKSFALKMPNPSAQHDCVDFEKEANILRRYGSPYIVGLVGCWKISRKSWYQEQKTTPFLMMEIMELNLKEFIHKVRKHRAGGREGFTPVEAINLMVPVAKAMQYLHEGAVAHRDLKPENIMCKYKGDVTKVLEDITVKLVDFGDAVKVGKNEKPAAGWYRAGTTGYMAPEVHKMKADDPLKPVDLLKADVFSFGMVFGEMLTWKAPREAFGSTLIGNQIQEKLKNGERPKLPAETPFYVKFIVESCWDEDPRIRPPFEDICWMLRHAKLLLSPRNFFSGPDQVDPYFCYTDDGGMEHAPPLQG